MHFGGELQFAMENVFRITIPLSEVATTTEEPGSNLLNSEKINGEINLSETDKKVLAVIKDNPRIKRSDIISSLKIGRSTLDRSL